LFYLPGTTGWDTASMGRPTVLWNGKFGVLTIQVCGGLTISGEVGKVYSIEYATDPNEPTDWHCLEFLQLPASPFRWADKSAPTSSKRFYRAVEFTAPTNMVFIPPGSFRMGSPDDEPGHSAIEGPQTVVILSRGFWMATYEVTQGEYEGLIGSNPSWFNGGQDPWGNPHMNYGVVLTRPVEQVSWYEAVAYCASLTGRERAAGRIPPNTAYRLPTEAEWEYACRAGTSTRFSYGDDPGHENLTKYAWYSDNSGLTTHPVGEKLPNSWGLHDMLGNVCEWCQDTGELDIYGVPFGHPGGILLDPQGFEAGLFVRFRGNYFGGAASLSRSALRTYDGPNVGSFYPSTGFRVVLAPAREGSAE
jgi:formylglycine-generating enzyme required for sulfatase activity